MLPEQLCEHLLGLLGCSLGALGASLGALGDVSGALGESWGAPGSLLKLLARSFGTPWGITGGSSEVLSHLASILGGSRCSLSSSKPPGNHNI